MSTLVTMTPLEGDSIGARLRRVRMLRGMDQEELAERAGVSRDLIAKLEQGRRHSARMASIAALAAALDVEMSVLTDGRALIGEQRGVLALRQALTGLDSFPGIPSDDSGDPTPLPDLQTAVTRAWRQYWAGNFTAALSIVEEIEPNVGKAPLEHVSVWGSLLLTGLAASAACGDRDRAADVLSLARAAGGRLGEQHRNDYETYFAPVKVATESVHAAVKLGEPKVALDRARDVPPYAGLPTAARGRHLLDVAQAQATTRQYQAAVETLLAAERLSPEWMRHQTVAVTLVRDLVERHRRLPGALKGLASRLHLESVN